MTHPRRKVTGTTPILEPLATEEYAAPPRTELQRRARAEAVRTGADAAGRLHTTPGRYWASRQGTAAGLRALNAAAGDRFFDVPPEAEIDAEAAEDAFAADGPVVDVQTHWVADRPDFGGFQRGVLGLYRHLAPDWWSGLDGMTAYTLAEYLRCVFVESETALAVISASPADEDAGMFLNNPELAALRELFDRTAGAGRLLNHTVVRPNHGGDIDHMAEWAAIYGTAAWKVYTLGMGKQDGVGFVPGSEWRLDDDETGMPFLEAARSTGVPRVCADKGVSGLVASGSPSDVGPAAAAFPDIDFLVYHSGYEPGSAEGPFGDPTTAQGIDRLVDSVRTVGLGAGSNVYAELGTTWFCLVSRPHEAAHVLGKLLLHLGEDNVIWGTDAIWYGPTQPVLDAFRTFQIPDRLCEEFGYPKITPETRRKVLAGNAARVYGVDLDALALATNGDDVMGWTREALREAGRYGLMPGS